MRACLGQEQTTEMSWRKRVGMNSAHHTSHTGESFHEPKSNCLLKALGTFCRMRYKQDYPDEVLLPFASVLEFYAFSGFLLEAFLNLGRVHPLASTHVSRTRLLGSKVLDPAALTKFQIPFITKRIFQIYIAIDDELTKTSIPPIRNCGIDVWVWLLLPKRSSAFRSKKGSGSRQRMTDSVVREREGGFSMASLRAGPCSDTVRVIRLLLHAFDKDIEGRR
ncbi:uncharacterized protein EV420DRAFT_884687 [Desarmillaria tabescens]|uniref:Uncharacterized protein n=1 Tax=Armillaria tabescens TaxID=1929756 RepID=A0AA39JS79_ARMTA|nr:uncharacterized protein EV420DRAFT_884687 [Desarmillaria tabescens]KAK0446985.1 hypothetical protein EV420DRAFT_884687 [Desarmillaria tabescens]